MANVVQRSFAGGEVSSALYARADFAKYAIGCRTLRNWIITKLGAASNRPGTQYLASVKDSTKTARLFKFVFENIGTSNTYVIEAGDLYFRWYQNGGQVVTSGVSAWADTTAYAQGDLVTQGGVTYYCIVAHTSATATNKPGSGSAWQTNWYAQTGSIYEIPAPFAAADLPDVQYVQSKDVITFVHPSYPPQELKRLGHTKWTLNPIVFGPATGTPGTLSVSGGLAGPSQRYWAVTAIDAVTNEESLPGIVGATTHVPDAGTPSVISWALVSGADTYNVYRSLDGVSYGYIGSTGGTPNAATDTSWTSASDTVTTTTPGSWVASGAQARNPVVAAATDKATDGNYHLYGRVTIVATSLGGTPTITLGRLRAYYSRDAEPRVDAGIIYGPATLSGAGTSGPNTFDKIINVPDNGYAALTIDIVPEVLGQGTGSNQYQCTVDETAGPNNRIDWNKGGTSYSDANTTANMAQQPPAQPAMFASATNYPSAVGYYQQRQLFGNTPSDPERVWASRSASFKSFATSTPLKDDDAISFRMAGQRLNAMRHFIDLYGRLLVFAQESEWTIEGDDAGTLKPTAINPRQQTGAGTGRLHPLIIVSTVLFVQAMGGVIRDLRKAIANYDNSDLTIFAQHLFEGYTLSDWDYAQIPHSIVWGVRSDGTLLGLTYIPDQDIWGWHRHDTDGAFENVCVVPEGNEHAVYAIVRRTINGSTVRMVERFVSRAITALTDVKSLRFMDACVSYDGRNTGATTMTLSGGSAWDESEQLTCTASVGTFASSNVGDRVDLTAADGTTLRCTIEAYTSATVITVRPAKTVPADLRSNATTAWALAVDTVSGLGHLEGKHVAVYGDATVVASPNNPSYPVVTVSSGSVTLPAPYAVIHVGLPYVSDLETLDIESASGPSLKETFRNVSRVGIYLKDTRGLWSGPSSGNRGPTTANPVQGLQELKLRNHENYTDPTALVTNAIQVGIDPNWTDHGRIMLRQVDPLPATILSVTPMGKL